MKTFSARLESLQKGRTQKEFAKLIDVPLNTYTAWLRGERAPSFEAIARICRATGVSADWLLGLNDASPASNPRAESAEEKLRAVKKSLIALIKEL